MSVNIPALLSLFPERVSAITSDDDKGGFIRGRSPYDDIKSLMREVLAPELIAAVESVRSHERWGRVYAGDLSDYSGDHSRADLALCGEFARLGLKGGGIDTAFRTSGLYRDKWERDDYRNRTIAKALENVRAKADDQPNRLLDLRNGKIVISTAEPPARDWTIDGLLLAGKSAVLGGFGGVSKTQLAIQLSIAIVLGNPFMGKAVKSGGVMLILGEEDRDEIARRVNAVVRHQELTPEEIQRIESNMLAFPLVGQDTRLTTMKDGALDVTAFARGIVDAANSMGNVRFIVLDHLALFHGGDFNAREDAALTMRVVNHICQETCASVLVLAHTPKSANLQEESDASMVAGSTTFVDQARGAWILATMREQEAMECAPNGNRFPRAPSIRK